MSALLTVCIALAALLSTDFLRWKIVVRRELKRRNLARAHIFRGRRVTPAKGYRIIEVCTCERDGKQYDVVIMNRGWLRTLPSVDITEIRMHKAMTTPEKQKWERVRSRVRARYILRGILFYGVPMWFVQTFGIMIYHVIMHEPYVSHFQNMSSVVIFGIELALWIFGFGAMMGESLWQKRELNHREDDRLV